MWRFVITSPIKRFRVNRQNLCIVLRINELIIDIFTKPLSKDEFVEFIDKLGVKVNKIVIKGIKSC
jgi:hypothetical protein